MLSARDRTSLVEMPGTCVPHRPGAALGTTYLHPQRSLLLSLPPGDNEPEVPRSGFLALSYVENEVTGMGVTLSASELCTCSLRASAFAEANESISTKQTFSLGNKAWSGSC